MWIDFKNASYHLYTINSSWEQIYMLCNISFNNKNKEFKLKGKIGKFTDTVEDFILNI
jgi:hypothetical protein